MMEKSLAEVSLSPDGDEFVLKRRKETGEEYAIRLSPMDVLNLPRLITKPIRSAAVSNILGMLDQSNAEPRIAPVMAGFEIGSEVFGGAALLTIRDVDGGEFSFAMTLELLGRLSKAIVASNEELASGKTPTKQ